MVANTYVAVAVSRSSVKRQARVPRTTIGVATMNTTKEALKAAPEFKYPK
jgi:hypothetical protein